MPLPLLLRRTQSSAIPLLVYLCELVLLLLRNDVDVTLDLACVNAATNGLYTTGRFAHKIPPHGSHADRIPNGTSSHVISEAPSEKTTDSRAALMAHVPKPMENRKHRVTLLFLLACNPRMVRIGIAKIHISVTKFVMLVKYANATRFKQLPLAAPHHA